MAGDAFLEKIPPLEDLMPALGRKLEGEGKLALVSIDTQSLLELETAFDRTMYDTVRYAVQTCLRDLCGYEIRQDDLIASNLSGGKKYYIFLSHAREKLQADVDDLEKIALRVQEFIYNRLFRIFYPLTQRGPEVRAGYGMTFSSAQINPKSLIQNLIDESEALGFLLERKIALLRRTALYDVLSRRKLLVSFQPIVDLETKAVVGYEALSGGPTETFLGTGCNLHNYAREAGLARELTAVCLSEIVAKTAGLDRSARLFITLPPEAVPALESKAASLSAHLRQQGWEPGRLVIEVHLRPVPADLAMLEDAARWLPEAVFSVELDETWTDTDFHYLSADRIGFVKTGREFFSGADRFMRALAAAVRRWGKTLIASGIINRQEAETLASLGAAAGAGPYFARAASVPGAAAISNEDLKDRFLQKKLLLSIYLKRGRDYFHQGDFDKAILEFSKVIEIDPLNVESHYYRGHAFCADDVLGMAVKDWLRLKELDPDYPNRWLLEGLIAEKKGETGRARHAYQEYVERAAQSFDSEIALAQARIQALREEK